MSAGRIMVVAFALAFIPVATPVALAGADTEPVIVVPGRPGVPIIVEGQDVSGAVIEGEWGLARGHTGITIIKPHPANSWRRLRGEIWGPPVGRYFPGTGQKPRVGRLEVIPPADRALPPPVELFGRAWETQSAPLPPTLYPPYEVPLIGPLRYGGRHGPHRNEHP